MASESRTIELLEEAIRVGGSEADAPLDVLYGELSGVWLEHTALVLERRNGERIRVRSEAQPHVLLELARRIARILGLQETGSFAIVVPLKPGAREQARSLISEGPPFDPEALGIRRHQVFLSANEAFFLFESAAGALEELLGDPGALIAATAWRDCVGGLAYTAEEAYSWEAPS